MTWRVDKSHVGVTEMGFTKIRGKLTSRIGCRVTFGAPSGVQNAGGSPGCGTIVDEFSANPAVNDLPPCSPAHEQDWRDYSFQAALVHRQPELTHHHLLCGLAISLLVGLRRVSPALTPF